MIIELLLLQDAACTSTPFLTGRGCILPLLELGSVFWTIGSSSLLSTVCKGIFPGRISVEQGGPRLPLDRFGGSSSCHQPFLGPGGTWSRWNCWGCCNSEQTLEEWLQLAQIWICKNLWKGYKSEKSAYIWREFKMLVTRCSLNMSVYLWTDSKELKSDFWCSPHLQRLCLPVPVPSDSIRDCHNVTYSGNCWCCNNVFWKLIPFVSYPDCKTVSLESSSLIWIEELQRVAPEVDGVESEELRVGDILKAMHNKLQYLYHVSLSSPVTENL